MISVEHIRSKQHVPGAIRRLRMLLEAENFPACGYEVRVTLARRTNPQNAHYWGVVVPMVADHLTEKHEFPYTSDMAHFLLKSQFLPSRTDPLTGRVEYGSTTHLARSGGEGSWQEYITKIQEWAAKSGCQIPDPNEEPA